MKIKRMLKAIGQYFRLYKSSDTLKPVVDNKRDTK